MVEITRTFDLLDHLVEQYPKEDILAGKVNGEWIKYSSHDYYKYAHYMAYGLCEMGLKEGDRVITMSANCPEWNFIDMALAMSGMVHVPIYPTLNTESYLHILKHSEAAAVFVSTKMLLGRLKPALDQMEMKPEVYTLMGVEGERRMLEILKAGIANREKWMPEIERRKREIKPEDWVTMIYTSGTTGLPKGVMLSHRNLCSNFLAHAQVNPMDSNCRALSFLPLNHIYERSLNYHWQYKGVSIYYAESLGTIQQNMLEIQGDGFCAVPRVLEMVYDKLYAAGKDFRGIKKRIYDWAFSHGKRYDYTLFKKVSLFYQLVQWFLDKAVYSKWREKFGGKKLTVITGGSSIQPNMVRLFAAAGINIYEGYGLSETSPVIAVNDPAHHQVKIGTVGPILSGVEVKFGDDGEILTRGPHVMLGYYKDPEYTAEVIDEDGWFHTGDIGTLVEGRFLKITDRKKEIFKLSLGKYIAPQVVESKLHESPYIENVMVIGENEKFASAIIVPSFSAFEELYKKRKQQIPSSHEEMLKDELFVKMMNHEVEHVNRTLAEHERIKRYRVVADEWIIGRELSQTMKLRRKIIYQKYDALCREIYNYDKKETLD